MPTSWETFFPLLAPHLPGVPYASMEMALAAASADFCARTHLWRETLDSEETVAGTATYDLFGSAVIESVLSVTVSGAQVAHTDKRLLQPSYTIASGRPTHYWIVNDSTIQFAPIPDTAYPFIVDVALKPARSATGVETWIYETWADALVDGAVWRLARIPDKSWSNLALAKEHKARFDRAIANAKTRDLRQINLRVKMRGF